MHTEGPDLTEFNDMCHFLIFAGLDFKVESDEALINIAVKGKHGEPSIIISFDAETGKPYHMHAERDS